MNRQRGAAATEVAVIVPVIVLFIGALGIGWRINAARTKLADAAASAARAASIVNSAAAAPRVAEQTVRADLDTVGLRCADIGVSVDTSGYWAPLGAPATVGVRVSCTVDMSDLGVAGLGGRHRFTATAQEALDTHRRRSP